MLDCTALHRSNILTCFRCNGVKLLFLIYMAFLWQNMSQILFICHHLFSLISQTAGLLTADPRIRERKKPGQEGAHGRNSLGKSAEQERINTAQLNSSLTGLLRYSVDNHTLLITNINQPYCFKSTASVKIHKYRLLVDGIGHLWTERRSFFFWDLTLVYIKAV